MLNSTTAPCATAKKQHGAFLCVLPRYISGYEQHGWNDFRSGSLGSINGRMKVRHELI